MVKGFVASIRFLLLPVERRMQPLDPTPLLGPHDPPSSLLRVGPSQCSASVRSPRGGCPLSFSLGIGATGSRSSTREPESGSRPLYAGRRPPSTPGLRRTLSQEIETPLVSTTRLGFTTRPPGFTCVRLPEPHLLGVRPRRFDSNAHHRRLLTAAAWSGLEPAPGSRLRRACLHLPCSLGTVSQLILNLLSVRLRRTLNAPMPPYRLRIGLGTDPRLAVTDVVSRLVGLAPLAALGVELIARAPHLDEV